MTPFELVTTESPHMSTPVRHGWWPTQDEARKVARSLVRRDEVAEIRQGDKVVETIGESTGSRWGSKPAARSGKGTASRWGSKGSEGKSRWDR